MTDPVSSAPPSVEDLASLEETVSRALAERDHGPLAVLGFGEISMALGWPIEEPRFACKRMPPVGPEGFAQYRDLVTSYVAALGAAGTTVVATEIRGVPWGEELVAYLVQPMLAADTLGERVLTAADPDPEHPFVVAVLDDVAKVSDRLSIDAQVTNWSWDGETNTLLDVGTPFLWDEQGTTAIDMTPFLKMIPLPLRPVIRRDLTKLLERWRRPRGVALDLVANLYREGLDPWVEPVLEACNRRLDVGAEPLRAEEAEALYAEDVKTWPRLKKLQVMERAWQTRIRRRPYDFFIQNSYDGTTR